LVRDELFPNIPKYSRSASGPFVFAAVLFAEEDEADDASKNYSSSYLPLSLSLSLSQVFLFLFFLFDPPNT
jgi:hypothetical protein